MKNSFFKAFVYLLASSILISCSSKSRSPDRGELDITEDPYENAHDMPAGSSVEVRGEFQSRLARNLPDKDKSQSANRTNAKRPNHADAVTHVPMVHNEHVEKWIQFFQTRGKDLMTRYLQRSSRYIPMMKEVLRSHGLPEELVYIALIESGFTARARSHAGAVGYWQFMRGTARDFGLKVDNYVDERRDPIKATHAAARYLNGVYHVFGSWYLAIASYNVGHNKMKGVVMRNQTRDFWELVREKKLPSETLNYVPKFLAAWMIGENPKKYGFTDLDYQPAMQFEEVVSERPLSLSSVARNSRTDLQELRRLNPEYRTDYAPLGRGRQVVLRVPVGRKDLALAALSQSVVNRPNRVRGASSYRVRRGDTLIGIANRNGVTVSELLRANRLSRKSVIRSGDRLRIPRRGESDDSIVAQRIPVPRSKTSYSRSHRGRSVSRAVKRRSASSHVVRRGDNLSDIAKEYRVSLGDLRSANGLRRGAVIRIGQRLKIPSEAEIAAKKVHRVSAGETLIGIANQYGVSLSDLRRANRLSRQSKLYVGARLQIPL